MTPYFRESTPCPAGVDAIRGPRERGRALGFVGAVVASVTGILRRPPAEPAAPPREDGGTGVLRPPGALDEVGFLATCIRCERCADACPQRCIRIHGPADGRACGTPYLASEDACDGCLECTRVCPSGALHRSRVCCA